MGKKKKYKWWCESCSNEWKAKTIHEDDCPECDSNQIFLCKRGKYRDEKPELRKPTIEQFIEFMDSLSDEEAYEGSLEVCDCEGQQVCDVCQGVGGEDINQGHYFEIMDRTHIIQCNIDDFLTDHPAMTPEAKRELSKVQDILTKIYQWSSGEWDNFDE